MHECPNCHRQGVAEPRLQFGGSHPPGTFSPTGGATFQYTKCQECQAPLRRPVTDGEFGPWLLQKT
jgi:hypothetical protein